MNIAKILAKVGGSIIEAVIPGAGIVGGIIDVVNAVLPGNKKLPKNATGTQAIDAINSLPPETQKEILSKELDVEIIEIQEYTKVISALAVADATGNTTRPEIALMMSKVTCFAIIVSVSVWAYAVMMNLVTMMEQLKASWPLLVAILGTPTALLRAYFAMRSKEKKSRYEIAKNPNPGSESSGGIMGLVKGVSGLFK